MGSNQFNHLTAGKALPDDFNAVIEIPSQSNSPVKYEVNKETGHLMVDRFIGTAMFYPCNYGFIPRTLSEDGDPIDVLVITPYPLLPGSVIRCRPLGLLKMTDESGKDSKILSVPINKITKQYQSLNSFTDVEKSLLDKIVHFFVHYKDLEEGKWVKLEGWYDLEIAKKEILLSVERYEKTEVSLK